MSNVTIILGSTIESFTSSLQRVTGPIYLQYPMHVVVLTIGSSCVKVPISVEDGLSESTIGTSLCESITWFMTGQSTASYQIINLCRCEMLQVRLFLVTCRVGFI